MFSPPNATDDEGDDSSEFPDIVRLLSLSRKAPDKSPDYGTKMGRNKVRPAIVTRCAYE